MRSNDFAHNELGQSGRRVMVDTGRAVVGTAAFALLVLVLGISSAGAEPTELHAKVIWAAGGRAYVASTGSLSVVEGDLLTFYEGKKVAAEGAVSNILDGTLAVVRLKSGSLDAVKKFDRLRIMSEHPRLRPVDVLRIGIPSRSNLLFACATPSVRSPLPRAVFRGEAISVRSFILARDKSDGATAQWPDTILVRLFDEETDEEIALERGELDAGVFWPGELSSHMRDDPKWHDFSYGTRSRVVLAALVPHDTPQAAIAAADSNALLAVNESVFRGDLVPWDVAAGRPAPTSAFEPDSPKANHRFEVDRSVPGWQNLERALRGGTSAAAANSDAPPIRVILMGSQTQTPEPAWFSFAARCPVVGSPGLRDYLKSLGPDALASIVDCAIARGGR
jgi:hypothetical protein